MSLFSLFVGVVMAAEGIISPLADSIPSVAFVVSQPSISFGSLIVSTPSPTPTPTPLPTPTPEIYRAAKKHYAIALLGDSMIDTLGPDAPHLKRKLTTLFPQTTFTILNYGAGGTNIDSGLERLTNTFTYLGNTMPPLTSQLPDIVVVESFGYNPYPTDTGSLDKHWMQLSKIIDTLKAKIPNVKIIIAATIAPNSKKFGDGAPNIAFSIADKWERTQVIKQYLDSTVKFGRSQNLPVADAYHASLDNTGDGILSYINGGDHIHYSDNGRILFAQKVTDAILTNKLLE